MNRIKAWLCLQSIPGLGNGKVLRLLNALGEPETFMYGNCDRLSDIDFISSTQIEYLKNPPEPESWDKISRAIDNLNIKFLTILDDNYPNKLKTIVEPPPFLFYRGTLKKNMFRRALGIVGTRKATEYGKMATRKICAGMTNSGFTIVSGLAYGIDSQAHRTCLDHGGITIAVMGTGVDQIYPPRNRELAEEIIEKGAILSEFIPTIKAERWNFPTRNRIISGLSLGTLVIEGNKKSGALLTAKFALDQNRDLFALPGDINREQAEGPNYLIQLGAKLVTSAKDILSDYDMYMDPAEAPLPILTPDEEEIYQMIFEHKPDITVDQLIIKSERSFSDLSSILLGLELKNMIKKAPGNKLLPMY